MEHNLIMRDNLINATTKKRGSEGRVQKSHQEGKVWNLLGIPGNYSLFCMIHSILQHDGADRRLTFVPGMFPLGEGRLNRWVQGIFLSHLVNGSRLFLCPPGFQRSHIMQLLPHHQESPAAAAAALRQVRARQRCYSVTTSSFPDLHAVHSSITGRAAATQRQQIKATAAYGLSSWERSHELPVSVRR